MTVARLVGPTLNAPSHATLNEVVLSAAKTTVPVVLVDAEEREISIPWSTIATEAAHVAAGLRARGIGPGDRVAIILPTGADFLFSFFGCLAAGAVPVPLYPPVRLGRFEEYVAATTRMLTVVNARLVISETRIAVLIGTCIANARVSGGVCTLGEVRGPDARPWHVPRGDDVAMIQFSSGSTVAPKAVALTHTNLVTQLQALHQSLPTPEGFAQCGVSWLPLYHDMGLIGCLFMGAYYPGKMVLLPPEVFLVKPHFWLRAISRHGATVSAAPNFAFGVCVKRIRDEQLNGVDLSSWHFALNGAEPVSALTATRFSERFNAFGLRAQAMRPVYGMSEASLAVTFSTMHGGMRSLQLDAEALAATGKVTPGSRALVSVGHPVPGATIELRDAAGEVINTERVGHIFVQAPYVFAGYVGDAKAVNAWHDTGDLGFISDDQLFITGRAKDLVIIRGANHAPQEFEECLEGLPGVRTGCAIALGFVPADDENEHLLLLVEQTDGNAEVLTRNIKAAVLERTGIQPHTVLLCPPGTLPRTSSGKLRRSEALQRFLSATLAPPETVTIFSMSKHVLGSLWSKVKHQWA